MTKDAIWDILVNQIERIRQRLETVPADEAIFLSTELAKTTTIIKNSVIKSKKDEYTNNVVDKVYTAVTETMGILEQHAKNAPLKTCRASCVEAAIRNLAEALIFEVTDEVHKDWL
jgi:hypothetical protein